MEAIKLEADAFLYSETELEEAMGTAPEIEGAGRAGSFLRAIAHYQSERETVVAQYDEVVAEYEASKQRKLEQIDRRIAWMQGGLQAHFVHSGQKKLDYPDGVMSMRKGRERVEITDEDAFCKTWNDTDLVAVTVTSKPDKKAIAAAIKETGEIPEGADIVRGDDTFVVKTHAK